MKRKHLFASVAMAAVLAGCSQEELTNVNNQVQNLGDRPMVEAPTVVFGGAGSRMTTADGYASVEWQEGDGFGAAVMDSYNPDGETWAEMFPIQNYINSNVLFKTEDGSNFYAEASMPMGNHLFYAPFNKNNVSRAPLAVQLPLEQVVVPVEDGVSNSIIKAFYEDKSSPVFVAYDSVTAPKTVLEGLEMRHIYSLPLVTLELGNVQLLDEEGELKNDGTKEKNPVYETEITVDSIKFVSKKIVTEGSISNDAIFNLLQKKLDENGNWVYNKKQARYDVVWDATEFETNATADLLNEAEADAEYDEIVVKFEGGQKITKAKPGKFFMVLPGAEYAKDDLKVVVYTTINGESYWSAVESDDLESSTTISPAKDMRLLPGRPYSADEYNKDGSMKDSKGTSMTYTVAGGFIPVEKAVITGYTKIEDYDDLVNFITKVAYRGEKLIEITKNTAETWLTDGDDETKVDPKKHFVITAKENAPIALDDEFVSTFENACVLDGKVGTIEFIGGNKNLVLGDITWDATADKYFSFTNAVYTNGNTTLKVAVNEKNIYPLAGATLTLDAALTETVTVSNQLNGTINVNSAAAHTIWNDYGTLNVNASTAAVLNNGMTQKQFDNRPEINEALGFDKLADYVSTMVIADNVKTSGTVNNRLSGDATIGDAVVSLVNNGDIEMNAKAAELTITSGEGTVNNTIGAKIYGNSENTVYANVTTFNLNGLYDHLAGLNKLVVNGVITWGQLANSNSTTPGINFMGNNINVIDFIEGGGINLAGYTSGTSENKMTIDLSSVEKINIKADVTWRGREAGVSQVKVAAGAIDETSFDTAADDKVLTLKDISIPGYNYASSSSDIATAIAGMTAGETATFVLSANANGSGIKTSEGQTVIIDLNGKTLDISGTTVGSSNTATIGLQLLKGSTVTLKNGTIKATSATCKRLIQNYANLTLENVNVVGNENMGCVLSFNNGTVNIIGNTNITATAGNIAFDVCNAASGSYTEGAKVYVETTGTITGKVQYNIWDETEESSYPSTLTVSKATINGDLEVVGVPDETAKTNIELAKDVTTSGTTWDAYKATK